MTQTAFASDLNPASRRKGLRARSWCVIGAIASLGLSWTAIHEIPGFAPWAADTLREAIGVQGVAQLEDTVYQARDEMNLLLRAGEQPKNYWDATSPAKETAQVNIETAADKEETPAAPAFSPSPVGPLFSKVAAPGDGRWTRVETPSSDGLMFKTLLHPDPARTWAELFVVAIDLRESELHLVAGSREPLSQAPGAESLKRSGAIKKEHYGALLAAFNGGFKTQHGGFGAKVEGVTLVSPKARSCTIAMTGAGELKVGTWTALDQEEDYSWFRQTPGCMVEDGELHPGLRRDDNTNWGATLDGGTVIRRSALGLSPDEKTLYVGISNDTTARALALGMRHAGAQNVAQLDVNYSYPKFMLYEATQKEKLAPRSLFEGFVFHEEQYLKKEARDFFYLTQKSDT